MKKFLLTLSLLLYALIGYSQSITYNDDGSVSYNTTTLQTITYDNVDFNYMELLKPSNQYPTGIIGDINQGGGIILEVYCGPDKDELIFKKNFFISIFLVNKIF